MRRLAVLNRDTAVDETPPYDKLNLDDFELVMPGPDAADDPSDDKFFDGDTK